MVPGKVFELTGTQVLDDAVTAVNLLKMTSRADVQTMFLAGSAITQRAAHTPNCMYIRSLMRLCVMTLLDVDGLPCTTPRGTVGLHNGVLRYTEVDSRGNLKVCFE